MCRHRRLGLTTILLAAVIVLAAAGVASARAAMEPVHHSDGQTASDPHRGSPPVAPAVGVSVHGNRLFVNGMPWVPRGVQVVGLVAPDNALSGKYVAAHAHFGAAELATAVADHADVVRFQVSEFGVDPLSALYSPAYVQEVAGAVRTARSLGLMVIVSLQAQAPAGEPNHCPLPDAGAERAWNELAPMFASDHGVMFELYNEPWVAATAAGWALWRTGGVVAYGDGAGSCQAVGMQTLIYDIRADGAGNVIVVPGAGGEQTLAGMPKLDDPNSPDDPQFAYGVHYPPLAAGVTAWDSAFGARSADAPVIVTEWDAAAIQVPCTPQVPSEAQLLLDYLAGKRIGIVGFALDLPGTIVDDYSYTPTSYAGFSCGVPGGGPGQMLFAAYAAEAQAGDGTQPAPAPAWLLGSDAAARLTAAAPETARRLFDTPGTFVIGAGGPTLGRLGIPTAIPTESFADERALAAAVAAGRLRPGTKAVVYAPAHAASTPLGQQRRPGRFFARAAAIAHAHGLLLIAAPATTLVEAIAPGVPAGREMTRFLGLRIAALAARYADVFETQAQGAEATPTTFAAFVRRASAQAARAHRGIELLAELRTEPGASGVTASVLFKDLARTRSTVSGYFLVDPPAGNTAVTGGDIAITLLRELVGHGG